MMQSNYCQACGGQKAVFVTKVDSTTNALLPGDSLYMPQNMVSRWECACSVCGIVYSLNSLSNPVELYE
jgi:uncharacterized cupin superfamily protein